MNSGTYAARIGDARAGWIRLATAMLLALALPVSVPAVLVEQDGSGYYRPDPADLSPTGGGAANGQSGGGSQSGGDDDATPCPEDVCAEDGEMGAVYEALLGAAIASKEPFTIETGSGRVIEVENIQFSLACADVREALAKDCEEQAWEDYLEAIGYVNGGKPGPWSDFAGAWADYQTALERCDDIRTGPYQGESTLEITADLVSGSSEGTLTLTGSVTIDPCTGDICLTDVEYSSTMNGWLGFISGVADFLGFSTDLTLVDGNGNRYPLDGTGGEICF